MSTIQDRIIKAILTNSRDFIMSGDDIQKATIRDVMLFYAYTKIIDSDFSYILTYMPKRVVNGYVEFGNNHDALSVAYCLARNNWMASVISQEAKTEIAQIAEEYNLVGDLIIDNMFNRLGIENHAAKNLLRNAVLKSHGFSNTKKASD